MPLKTLVKVGTVTNLSDARYCAGMGVEMLGFNVIADTENYINSKNYQDIRGWISGPLFVVEVYGFKVNTLPEIIKNYVPDFVELALEDLANLPDDITTSIILSLDEMGYEKHKALLSKWQPQIAYVILKAGENKVFLDDMVGEFPILLSHLQTEDVHQQLNTVGAKGIVLNGSPEIKPGLKDYNHLAEILEQLEID